MGESIAEPGRAASIDLGRVEQIGREMDFLHADAVLAGNSEGSLTTA
jgi:hypothetical protein